MKHLLLGIPFLSLMLLAQSPAPAQEDDTLVIGGAEFGRTPAVQAANEPTHVHDMYAAIRYLLGVELPNPYSWHDFRLTDTAGEVIHDIVA